MDDIEIKSVLAEKIRNCKGLDGDTISMDREDNLKRYYALPYGDEVDGKSRVLTTECRDTVLWLLPSVIKTFLSTDKVVEFLPASSGKEEEAEQQTDFVNYIVMQENDAFKIFYTWFLDALQAKNGYIKYGHELLTQHRTETYTGIDEMSLIKISEDHSFKIIDVEEEDAAPIETPEGSSAAPTYSVKVRKISKDHRYYIENLPFERVFVDAEATGADDVSFLGVVYYKSRSDLIKMGYDRALVESLPATTDVAYGTESGVRDEINGDDFSQASELVEIIECYVKIDEDGDGIDELRRIVVTGRDVSEILEDEEANDIPIVPATPFLKPHSYFGDSLVDYTKDLQRINTSLLRQVMNYFYLANNPMREVVIGNIPYLSDVQRWVPGGLVRSRVAGSVTPIQTAPLQPETFNMFDRLKDMKDRRTGVMEINQGLDPNAINKTATGTLEIMDAGRQIQDMIVRTFAETGMKRLFKGLYGLIVKHQDIPRTVRLRNKWVTVDPTKWDDNVSVTVNVGLGTGSERIRTARLEGIMEKQVALMPYGIVTPQNLYNTAAKMIIEAGYKDVDAFLVNPATLPPPPEEPPKPSPEEIALQEINAGIQKEQIKAEAKKYDTDKQTEVDLIENETDERLKMMSLHQRTDYFPGVPDV